MRKDKRQMKPRAHTAPVPFSPDDHIHGRGLRMTEQRRAVYDALMGKRDHPTAVEVFMRVKGEGAFDLAGHGL